MGWYLKETAYPLRTECCVLRKQLGRRLQSVSCHPDKRKHLYKWTLHRSRKKCLTRSAFFGLSYCVKYQLIRLPVRHIMTGSSYSGRIVCHPLLPDHRRSCSYKYIQGKCVLLSQTHLTSPVSFKRYTVYDFTIFYRQTKDTLSTINSKLFSVPKALYFGEIPTITNASGNIYNIWNQQHLKFDDSRSEMNIRYM